MQDAENERYGLSSTSLGKALLAWRAPEEIAEAKAGVRCLAAPVFDHLARPVAAISVAFPLFRFDEARREGYITALKAAAAETSAALGHRA